MRRIVNLIPLSKIDWGKVKKRMTGFGINIFTGNIAKGFFMEAISRKSGEAYVVQPHHLWTLMRGGHCMDELFNLNNPPDSWIRAIRRVNKLGISVADSLARGYPLIEDGQVLSTAIKKVRPDLWSVIENSDGYSEKYIGWSARRMLDKLIKLAEDVESGRIV